MLKLKITNRESVKARMLQYVYTDCTYKPNNAILDNFESLLGYIISDLKQRCADKQEKDRQTYVLSRLYGFGLSHTTLEKLQAAYSIPGKPMTYNGIAKRLKSVGIYNGNI